MLHGKVSRNDSGKEDAITELLNLLKSRGILEQLRLECVADVKTKATYLQLKERLKVYITTAMAKDWDSDNTFREQVIECGVVALTVERIVEEVVRRKLQERIKPLMIEMIKELGDENLINKIKGSFKEDPHAEKVSYEQTADIVHKICKDMKANTKKVLEGGNFVQHLASVPFSNSAESEDENMPEGVDSHSKMSVHRKNARSESKTVPNTTEHRVDCKPVINGYQEPIARSRRERKVNPKYSSELYQTSYRHSSPPSNLTPKKEIDAEPMASSSNVKASMKRKIDELHMTPVLKIAHCNKVKTEHCNSNIEELPIAVKSAPVLHKKVSSPDHSIKSEDSHSVRKSNRPRKINARLFQDAVPQYPVKGLRTILPSNDVGHKSKHMKAELNHNSANAEKASPDTRSSLSRQSRKHISSDLCKPRHKNAPSKRTHAS